MKVVVIDSLEALDIELENLIGLLSSLADANAYAVDCLNKQNHKSLSSIEWTIKRLKEVYVNPSIRSLIEDK